MSLKILILDNRSMYVLNSVHIHVPSTNDSSRKVYTLYIPVFESYSETSILRPVLSIGLSTHVESNGIHTLSWTVAS